MKSIRKSDEMCHLLSNSQARIFEKSVSDGVSSYFFIKSFMTSSLVKELDQLNLEYPGLSEIELYNEIKQRVKTSSGVLLPFDVMHWIGYLYRSMSYIYSLDSKFIFENVPPSFLVSSYPTLHALNIEEAISEIISIRKIHKETYEERFLKFYKI